MPGARDSIPPPRPAPPEPIAEPQPAPRFTWPPAPLPAAPASVSSVEQKPAKKPFQPSLWRLLERAWLAPTAEPFAAHAAAAGWAPDEFGVYCDRCAQTIGPHEHTEFGCSVCRERRLPWDRAVRLGEHSADLRHWVHEIKFTKWRRLGWDLGLALGQRLRDAGFPAHDTCVVPIPLATLHRYTRGIDHAAVIAGGVAHALGCPVRRLLWRERRPSQRGLTVAERRRNMAGAFALRARSPLPAGAVVVVDDVMTTGATMAAACRALRGRRGRRPSSAGGRRADFPAVWAAILAVAGRETASIADSGAPGCPERRAAQGCEDSLKDGPRGGFVEKKVTERGSA